MGELHRLFGQADQHLVGLGSDGIAGARLMEHHEPIVLIGIPPERIDDFIHGYVGRDVIGLRPPARRGPRSIS